MPSSPFPRTAPAGAPSVSTAEIHGGWQAAGEETVRHLQKLIQTDTTNPPGNELALARYLEVVLSAEGIETHLFEPFRNRAAVVARIPGTGAARPVMLLAHMDVVGVERKHWSVDPFGGIVKDGYVYGRGAIDDKGMLAVNLMTMLLLQRRLAGGGDGPTRDIVFVATSDEEAGGEYGIEWLIDKHPELIQCEFALNEGGRIRIVNGAPLYVAVQTSEKVSHLLTVTARGPAGHASVPLAGNAVLRLGRALAAIGGHREPLVLLPTTRRFFEHLSRVWPDPAESRAMMDVVSDDPGREAGGATALGSIPAFDAVLRTGISPTIVRGGATPNVIPGEAEAVLCVRTLPGEQLDATIRRLSDVVADENVEITTTARGEDSPVSDFGSPLFAAIEETAQEIFPGIVTVPYLSTGTTDSAHLRRHGVQAFGLLPFPLEPVDERRMHGHDERVPVSSLALGTRLVFETVRRVSS
ncbi:MAG TPA: M20/M25/M40 family metallo-hydrolase [Gemmatimonadaceae bacterium]|nr:M20/M25/M40 family metallo-hydrolase [Gemmatimonadaceae bacterium]